MNTKFAALTAIVTLILPTSSQAQAETDYLSTGPILISNIAVIDGLGNEPVAGQDILVVTKKSMRSPTTAQSPLRRMRS